MYIYIYIYVSNTRRNYRCFVFMDSACRKNRSGESPAEVVVEVSGIFVIHLANLQCGQRHMVFVLGSWRSRNYVLVFLKHLTSALKHARCVELF